MNTEHASPLPLTVVGYDFRRAGASVRSALVIDEEEQASLLLKLSESGLASGLAILNTCNRNEWIASSATPSWTAQILRAQMITRLRQTLKRADVPEPYLHVGTSAVKHCLEVATGLKSFVPGDRQIGYQLSKALNKAKKENHSSVIINGLAPICGRAARQAVRTDYGDPSIRGVHDVAIRYLTDRFPPNRPYKILVIGWGAIGRQTVSSIRARTNWVPTIMNRTQYLSDHERIYPLTELSDRLADHDIVVLCSGASEPVLHVHHLAKMKPGKNIIIVDLGIPIQTERAVEDVDGITLVTLDTFEASDMVSIRESKAVRGVYTIVDTAANEFDRYCRERHLVNVLNTTQTQHERFVHTEIPSMLVHEFPEMSDSDRNRLAYRLRGLVREYTNAIFESIHQITKGTSNE